MNLSRRQLAGGALVVSGVGVYIWLMAAELIPAALELAGNLGVPASAPAAWVGLTAAALAVALGVNGALSRKG